MHETAIANGIISEVEKHGNVREISLEIGELAHVPAKDLLGCLEKLVDWKINHSEIKADSLCSCGYRGPPKILQRGHDSFMIECPDCKSIPELRGGTEIKILSVMVD